MNKREAQEKPQDRPHQQDDISTGIDGPGEGEAGLLAPAQRHAALPDLRGVAVREHRKVGLELAVVHHRAVPRLASAECC